MNAEDQNADSPSHTKSRSGPGFLSLSRCAACYNEQKSSKSWHGGDGESSTSAEDSGPEVDYESEAESSSSSCCSRSASSAILEEPDTERPSPLSGGKDGDGREETGETSKSREDKSQTKGVTQGAPLAKPSSLPTSFPPNLIPLSLLPRPETVVSTLHLQVLPQTHTDEAFSIVKQQEEKTEESAGGGQEGVNHPQAGSQWQQWSQPTLQQHQLSCQYQQQPHQVLHQHQQPQHFPPLSAQGQRLPPPLHPPPALHPLTLHTPLQTPNASHTRLDAPTPHPCWFCHSMHFRYFPYSNHYSSAYPDNKN